MSTESFVMREQMPYCPFVSLAGGEGGSGLSPRHVLDETDQVSLKAFCHR